MNKDPGFIRLKQVAGKNGKPVTYDADGNMLEASIGKFTYDSANRLTVAGTRYYTYDVEGTRIKTQKGEDTTEFVYNVNARISQLLIKTENNAVTKYVYGLGLIGEEVSGNFKTYHFDYRGSTVAITDSNCNITDTFTYDTYGKLTTRTGTTKTPFLYNGRDGVITEDDTGLIYMRARYYSPALRRFVNADIVAGGIDNAGTLNRYAYCNGDPANGIDPLGLSAERVGIGASMGAGFGISETTRRRIYNEAIRKYRKRHPVGKIDHEEVLKILKEIAHPRQNVEKNYLPHITFDTGSAIYVEMDDIGFIPADENSEFGYIKYEDELYPIKYFDYAQNQSYIMSTQNIVAKCCTFKTKFDPLRAITGSEPEGLPDANDRVIYTKNGVRLQSPSIGKNRASGMAISGAVAVNNAYRGFQNGLIRDNLMIEVSADSSGTDRSAVIYSYSEYLEQMNDYTDTKYTSRTYQGIDENGNLFVVN